MRDSARAPFVRKRTLFLLFILNLQEQCYDKKEYDIIGNI